MASVKSRKLKERGRKLNGAVVITAEALAWSAEGHGFCSWPRRSYEQYLGGVSDYCQSHVIKGQSVSGT